MNRISIHPIRTAACCTMFSLLAAPGLLLAQDQADGPPPADSPYQSPSTTGGWRKVSEPPPSQSAESSNPNYSQNQAPDPNQSGGSSYDPNYTLPSQLTIGPGTFVTVRIDQELSSDRNQPGDAFSATLVKPIVVNGVVVSERGQTVGGRVTEVQSAGRIKGVSRLGIELTELTLVDGQQVPIQSQFVNWTGSRSYGRDAGAIAGTTALGAVIGSAADWGRGAAIGAATGAAAGTIGVLLTRGRPVEIYPESVLTFRFAAPVTISTDQAPQAFRYVSPDDYERPYNAQVHPRQPVAPYNAYGYPPPPPYFYGPAYYPYYYGPSFGLFYGYGPRYYYGPRFYRGHGFGRHYRR